MRTKRAALPVTLLGLGPILAGCAFDLTSDHPPKAQPLELSYRQAAESAGLDRAKAIAEALSGVYVRVQILQAPDPTGGRDAKREPGIITSASGAIVDSRGYVVTTAHIATSPEFNARITTSDGRVHEAEVVAVAPERELALLKMQPYPGMRVARLGDSAKLKAGDPVLTIGTPENEAGVVIWGRILKPKVEQRIQYDRYGYDDAIELVLDAEPGNSGGPLFSGEGELIGIVASFSLGNTNPDEFAPTELAWAVPAAAIADYLREVAGP